MYKQQIRTDFFFIKQFKELRKIIIMALSMFITFSIIYTDVYYD